MRVDRAADRMLPDPAVPDRMMPDGTVSDRALWDRVRVGDPDALTELYLRHSGAVFNHCWQRLNSRVEAEDLTAEVFLVALRSRRPLSVPDDGGLRPWLLGVANVLLRKGRGSSWARRVTLQSVTADSTVPDIADAFSEQAERDDALRLLRLVLLGLPVRDQEIIQLCVLQGLSSTSVAGLIGSKPATVRSRLSRALDRARRRLTQLQDGAAPAAGPVENTSTEGRDER